MTRDEVKHILAVIDAAYPNFKVENVTETLNAWHFFLADYDYNTIAIALKSYVATSGSGFAPSVSELIGMASKPVAYQQQSEQEAWDLVYRAICRSAYNSKEEFDKLPLLVQKAVGSPSQLKEWAIEGNFNHSVESSNFKRTYRRLADQEQEFAKMPIEMKTIIERTQLIESNM